MKFFFSHKVLVYDKVLNEKFELFYPCGFLFMWEKTECESKAE